MPLGHEDRRRTVYADDSFEPFSHVAAQPTVVQPASHAVHLGMHTPSAFSSRGSHLRAFGVLLESVRHRDRSIAEELPIHRLDRTIRRFKTIIAHESKPPRISIIRISHDLGRRNDHSKCAERIIEQLIHHTSHHTHFVAFVLYLFVDIGIEITDEEIGSDVEDLLVL